MYTQTESSQAAETIGEAQAIIKAQLTQIRLLSHDNQIKTQQANVLKERVRELEEFNELYKKQLTNMEGKLRMYDQELQLKLQAEYDKNNKLQLTVKNQAKMIQQYQQKIKESESKTYAAEQEIDRLSRELNEVRQGTLITESSLFREIDRNRRNEDEIENMSENIHQLQNENQELKKKISQLTFNNENMMKLLEENEQQLKNLSNIQAEYKELQINYEDKVIESDTYKNNYENLKKKYEELFTDYQHHLIQKSEEDEMTARLDKEKYEAVEREINVIKMIIDEKEKEIRKYKDHIVFLETELKEKTSRIENEIKKAVNFLDGQTTNIPMDLFTETIAMHLLMDNILRQNREFVKLNERVNELVNENKDVKAHLSLITEEKNDLKLVVDELEKANEVLSQKLRNTMEESVQNLHTAQNKFEERLEEMAKLNRENEERLHESLQAKEEELKFYEEELSAAVQKLNWCEDEKKKTLEFLKEQDAEIKEFKEKFFQLAEETAKQKNKISQSTVIIAIMTKLLFNLMYKYDALVYQKNFSSQYLTDYLILRQKLIEHQFIESPPTQRKNYDLYVKFKRVGYAVIAANRLKKVPQKQGPTKWDTFDVRLVLEDFPEGLKRFILDLFKDEKFVLTNELIASYTDLLNTTELENCSLVVGKIITLANTHAKLAYDPDRNYPLIKSLRKDHVQQLSMNIKLREDIHQKIDELERKLRTAENYILDQEEKFQLELDSLSQKLQTTTIENTNLKAEYKKILESYELSKQQIENLIATVNESKLVLSDSERRNIDLNDKYALLQREISEILHERDSLQKALESKDLRIFELEKQLIHRTFDDDSRGFINPLEETIRETQKVPGRIYRSSAKKSSTPHKPEH